MPIKAKLSVRQHLSCHINPTTWGSQAGYYLPNSPGKLGAFNWHPVLWGVVTCPSHVVPSAACLWLILLISV